MASTNNNRASDVLQSLIININFIYVVANDPNLVIVIDIASSFNPCLCLPHNHCMLTVCSFVNSVCITCCKILTSRLTTRRSFCFLELFLNLGSRLSQTSYIPQYCGLYVLLHVFCIFELLFERNLVFFIVIRFGKGFSRISGFLMFLKCLKILGRSCGSFPWVRLYFFVLGLSTSPGRHPR